MLDGMGASAKAQLGKPTYGARVMCGSARTAGARVCRFQSGPKPSLFRGSTVVRRQLAVTDGVIGFALLAQPFRKRYATLSVWTGEEALDQFTAATPHGEIMADLASAMGPTKFVK